MKKFPVWFWLVVLVLVVIYALNAKLRMNEPVVSLEDKVHEHVLSNGLKVLVQQDNRSPVVVSQVWYKVGSSYEYGGITGVSHVLEHMMFKGTQNLKPGEFSEIIARNGGRENAFTGRDYTAYFQTIAKDRLELCLSLEADRMRNINILDEEFAKEIEVVKEERRTRTDDNPQSLTYERFLAVAFTNSPYQNPIIGWMEDLDTMTAEDTRQWYRTWYAPNNATLVVVGDVEPEKVFALAEKYFGPLATSEITPVKPQLETKQRGQRRVQVNAPAVLPYLLMGYKVPVLATAEDAKTVYALEVLAGILDGGDSARFSRKLVRGKQIVAGANAAYDLTDRMQGLLVLSATPAQGVDIATVEKALLAEVDLLKQELVSEAELDRVKAQVIAGDVYQRDSMFYQGMKLGVLETVGLGWRVLDSYVDAINAVTAEEVQQVARQFLLEEQLTIGELVPQGMQTQVSAVKGGK